MCNAAPFVSIVYLWLFLHTEQECYTQGATQVVEEYGTNPAEQDSGHDDAGETIKLDQFLKLAGIVQTGGEAKMLIRMGEVRVNGEIETRRGRKLRHGDVVHVHGDELVVQAEND
jgi:ribosome-associated protein